MTTSVHVHIADLRECLIAAGHVALVRLLARVHARVIGQRVALGERFAAYRAGVGTFPAVSAFVLDQIAGIGEPAQTIRMIARERTLARVRASVAFQTRVVIEYFATSSVIAGESSLLWLAFSRRRSRLTNTFLRCCGSLQGSSSSGSSGGHGSSHNRFCRFGLDGFGVGRLAGFAGDNFGCLGCLDLFLLLLFFFFLV